MGEVKDANITVQAESLDLTYDEFCDLLGGSGWDEALERWGVAGLSAERHRSLEALRPFFSSPRQFMFSSDRSLFPLELFWLKWNLFTLLCGKMLMIHRDFRGPVLNLQPSLISVKPSGSAADSLPVRWIYSLTTALAAALPLSHADLPAHLTSRLFVPPPNLHPNYAASLLQQRVLGDEERVTVLIRSLERIREPSAGAVRGLLQIYLTSEKIRPSDFSLLDVLRVTFSVADEEASRVRIWGSKVTSSERGLLLNGETEPLPPAQWDALERSRQKVFSRASVAIYPSFHVPSDLFSLGMILLRTLAVNDAQEMFRIDEAARGMIEEFHPMLKDLAPDEGWERARRFRTRIRREGGLFSKTSVLYRRDDRARGAGAISDELWYDAITLAFRLLVWTPGFGYCQNHGDCDLEHPERLLEKVTREVEGLGERIKADLFGCRPRNREILEACDLVRKERGGVLQG